MVAVLGTVVEIRVARVIAAAVAGTGVVAGKVAVVGTGVVVVKTVDLVAAGAVVAGMGIVAGKVAVVGTVVVGVEIADLVAARAVVAVVEVSVLLVRWIDLPCIQHPQEQLQ